MIPNFIRGWAYSTFMQALLTFRLWTVRKNSRKGEAFIISGAESSGNRMIQRFFVDCGCFGDMNHKQILDYTTPEPTHKKIVWRTSIPQATIKNPNVEKMLALMEKLGYKTKVVEIRRNFDSTVESQVRREIVQNEKQAKKRIKQAWKYLDALEKKFPKKFIRIIYEDFVKDKKYRKSIAKDLGFEYNEKEVYEIKKRGNFETGKRK